MVTSGRAARLLALVVVTLMLRSRLSWLLPLALVLLVSCRGEHDQHAAKAIREQPSALVKGALGTASAVAPVSVAASDSLGGHSAPPSIAASSPADDGVPLPPAKDRGFSAFEAELLRRCQPPGAPLTTSDMVDHARSTANCLDGKLSEQARQLPIAARQALFVGEPIALSGAVPDWSPSWRRLLYANCGIQDAYQWQHGVNRVAGTLRYIDAASCPSQPTLELSYLLGRLASNDVDAVARRLKDTAAYGQRRLAALPTAIASAERMQRKAPEDSLFDEECLMCVLTDADWRRVVLRLHAFRDESARLAGAVCNAWPALAQRLGTAHCAERLQQHLAASLIDVPKPFESGDDTADLKQQAPAKDAGYARFIEPIIAACRPDENLHYRDGRYEESYRDCLKSHFASASRELPREGTLLAQLNAHRTALCGAEQRLIDADLSAELTHSTRFAPNEIEPLQCPALSYARALYLLHTFREHDPQAFIQHLRSRQRWADQVRRGIASSRAKLRAASCAEDFDQWDKSCRPRRLDVAAVARADASFSMLERSAVAAATASCEAWPELSSTLGGAGSCRDELSGYYLSQASYLGLSAEPLSPPAER